MAKAYNTVRVRKPLSPGWTRFAEGVVDRVGVRDEEQRELLVQAFASVPRDAFMPAAFGLRAAEDHAFPIGFGQTISKPTTVARMIAVAGIQPGMRVQRSLPWSILASWRRPLESGWMHLVYTVLCYAQGTANVAGPSMLRMTR
jgi:hypothetical protein